MARKRKIPARKHHGVRDPLKQLEEKEKKLANVTNNPPTQNDEQRVSYRFQQFKQLADATKKGQRLKRGHIGQEDKPKQPAKHNIAGAKKRDIKQFRDETDEDYLRRVNRITSASLREAQYETKYGVNVLRNSNTGEITIQKRPKNEIDELLKKKLKERRQTKNGRKKTTTASKPTMDAKTSKELIKRAFKEADESDDESAQHAAPAEYKRDVFRFGEIVHAPPSLTTLPRKATKNETVPRPGRKANLLLKSLLNTTPVEVTAPVSQTKKQVRANGTVTKAQLKGKRKELPAATRSMLEGERSKMVDIYRQLKKAREAQQH